MGGNRWSARDEILAAVPGARVEIFVGDACKQEDVQAALSFVHDLDGGLDILVPAIGGGEFRPLLMEDADYVRWLWDFNFNSVFLMIRYGAPMLRAGGSIVCISSAVAVQPYWGLGGYAATKSAVERLVRGAAFELGGAGIRVNAVRPGMTASRGTSEMQEMEGLVEYFASETVLGRIGEPIDLARVVRFLAGPESAWVTGQTFSVDGGQDQGKAPDMMDDVFGKDVMDRIRAGEEVPLTA